MSTTSEATGNDRRNLVNIQRIQIHKYHHQIFKSLNAFTQWSGATDSMLKRRLDLAHQEERDGQGFFLQKFIQIWKQIFQPRADLLKLQCNVLCGGEREQVPGEKKEMEKTYFFLKIYKTIVAGEQDGLLRGGGRPVLWDRGGVPLHPRQQVWHLLPT